MDTYRQEHCKCCRSTSNELWRDTSHAPDMPFRLPNVQKCRTAGARLYWGRCLQGSTLCIAFVDLQVVHTFGPWMPQKVNEMSSNMLVTDLDFVSASFEIYDRNQWGKWIILKNERFICADRIHLGHRSVFQASKNHSARPKNCRTPSERTEIIGAWMSCQASLELSWNKVHGL